MTIGLVIIDVQNDYFEGGAYAVGRYGRSRQELSTAP